MNALRIYLPAGVIVAVAAFWWSRQASEAATLRGEVATLRTAQTDRKALAKTQMLDEANELRDRIGELERAVAAAEAEAKQTEKSLAEVQNKLPIVGEGETVVSFGRISDMGREMAEAMRAVSALSTGQAADRSAEKLNSDFAKFVSWMPQIAGFEEDPAEIACFQTSLLREMFNLDDARAAQMEGIIKQHFAALKAAGLTAASSAQPTWKERRSAVLTPLLWQLRPFMPQDFKSPGMLSQIVNAGAGLETKSQTHLSKEPGKSSHSVSVSLPSWPRLPWLPPKPAGQ